MSNFYFYIFFLYIALLISPLINIIPEVIKTFKLLKILFSKINLRKELYNLSPREFELWCGEFLSNNGYSDVIVSPPGPDGGIDIRCFKNDRIVYVECKRYWFSKKATYVVDENIVKKLIGAMKADEVTDGIIITTGIVTSKAREFISTLPKEFKITVFDGNTFDTTYELKPFTLLSNL